MQYKIAGYTLRDNVQRLIVIKFQKKLWLFRPAAPCETRTTPAARTRRSSGAPAEHQQPPTTAFPACPLSALALTGRTTIRSPSGRLILLLARPPAQVLALDALCYHHGGPLEPGDVEELPGRGCILVCPWHRYRIDAGSGECLYTALIPGGPPGGILKSKGVKQRVHTAEVRGEVVWVTESSEGSVESDVYAFAAVVPGASPPGPAPRLHSVRPPPHQQG